MKQPMLGAHTESHEVNSPSIDEEQEALTQETGQHQSTHSTSVRIILVY